MPTRNGGCRLRRIAESLALALLAPTAPLMLVQGRRLQRQALRLPEAAGVRVGLLRPEAAGARAGLLILGDSSAAGVGVAEQSCALSGRLLEALAAAGVGPLGWRLIARTGMAAADLPDLLDEHLQDAEGDARRFDLAVVAVGVNDVTRATPIGRWLTDLDRIHDRLRRLGVGSAIFSGLPPMERFSALPQPLRSWLGLQARRYDRALAAWAASRPGALHLVLPRMGEHSLLAPDGFHPGEAGCVLWAGEIASILVPMLRAPEFLHAVPPISSPDHAPGNSRLAPVSSIAT